MLSLWVGLFALFVLAYQSGLLERLRGIDAPTLATITRVTQAPWFVPGMIVVLPVVILGSIFLRAILIRARARVAYLKALALPMPEPLIAAVDRMLRLARRMPDFDAMLAQARALAYSLYGDEAKAVGSLTAISWSARAPLVQATGLGAEATIELLCRRNAQRALELARQARAMASVSAAIPGVAQSVRYYHDSRVALCEAVLGLESATSIRALETSAADDRYAPLQLLGAYGLAAALERSGEAARATELRTFVRNTAPHCAPLQLAPAELATSGTGAAGPVSTASSAGPATGAFEQSAKRKLVRTLAVKAGLWLLLIAFFFVMRAYFSQPQ